MAVTQQQATQLSNTDLAPQVNNPTTDMTGKLRIARFNFTQSGEGAVASLAELAKLPPGNVRVILTLSRITFSAMGAARTMDLGWLAYTDLAGAAVAADPNGLDDGVDVSSAGSVNPGGTVGGEETYLFTSLEGVTITAQINDDVIDDGETLDGYLIYILD